MTEYEDFTAGSSGYGGQGKEENSVPETDKFFGTSLVIEAGATGRGSHVYVDGEEVPVFYAGVEVDAQDHTLVVLGVAGQRFTRATKVKGVLVDETAYREFRAWKESGPRG